MCSLKHVILAMPLLSFMAVHGRPTEDCPILGQAYPGGFDISKTQAFENVTLHFPERIEALFAAGILNDTHSSFIINVFSSYTNDSIYTYTHSGSALNETLTTGHLDDETIFRIGSVSKLHSVYAILAHFGNLDVLNHPVTRYLPELAGNAAKHDVEKITWEDITVGALASHQAGTGGFLYNTAACLTEPHPTCSNEGFLESLRDSKRPVMPAFTTAIYSDSGFGVLGRILERMTNMTYSDALQEILAKPLDMSSTSTFAPTPDGRNALVVPGLLQIETGWGVDNQVTAPSGGIYASAADLRKLGLSISHSKLLSPATTRQWMKPSSHSPTFGVSLGAPWEIFRLPLPVSPGSGRTRISDIYTKAGGNPGYSAIFGLSPDHEIGYSILVAGASAGGDRFILHDLVADVIITGAEFAAAENAASIWTGTYIDDSQDGANMTVTIDADRPGLGISSIYINGTDQQTNIFFPPGVIPAQNLSTRLYPIGPRNDSQVSFRAVASLVPSDDNPYAKADGGDLLVSVQCISFLTLGFLPNYDEIVFELVDGKPTAAWAVEGGMRMVKID